MMMVSWVVSSTRQPAGSHCSETREEKTEIEEEKQNFAPSRISERYTKGYNMVGRGNDGIQEPFSCTRTWVAPSHPFVDCNGNTDF